MKILRCRRPALKVEGWTIEWGRVSGRLHAYKLTRGGAKGQIWYHDGAHFASPDTLARDYWEAVFPPAHDYWEAVCPPQSVLDAMEVEFVVTTLETLGEP
jgi:hypothetical protein